MGDRCVAECIGQASDVANGGLQSADRGACVPSVSVPCLAQQAAGRRRWRGLIARGPYTSENVAPRHLQVVRLYGFLEVGCGLKEGLVKALRVRVDLLTAHREDGTLRKLHDAGHHPEALLQILLPKRSERARGVLLGLHQF